MKIEGIERALAASTPGRWNYGGSVGKYMVYTEAGAIIADVQTGANDAQFLAHSREWVEFLVRRVRELERREREWIPRVRERVQELEVTAREWVPALLNRIREIESTIRSEAE